MNEKCACGKFSMDKWNIGNWIDETSIYMKPYEIELLCKMDFLRHVCEEIHALRGKSGIKLRQPLASVSLPKKYEPYLNLYFKESDTWMKLRKEINEIYS